MKFKVGQRVIKIIDAAGPSGGMAPVDTRGLIEKTDGSMLPYLVKWDTDFITEWCEDKELELESVYDRAADLSNVDVIVNEMGRVLTDNILVSDSEYRKMLPVGTVITEYWPDALKGAAAVAWVGNEKHNPGEHLHWSRDKSADHVDCLLRHTIDAKKDDGWVTETLPDGRVYQVRHASAALWRAACLAQLDAESVGGQVIRRLK